MKKRILASALVAAISLSSAAVFAQDTNATVEKISEVTAKVEAMDVAIPLFVTNDLVANSVEENAIHAKDANQGDFIINTNESTLIFNTKGEVKTLKDITKDTAFTAYDYTSSPRLAIYPETYTAKIIVIAEESSMAVADTFKKSETLGEFVNSNNTLALNIAKETVIVNEKGEKIENANLDNSDLLVFYSMATFSIPAQTTPEKIVVLNKDVVESDNGVKAEKIAINSKEIEGKVVYKDDIIMLPLRSIIEAYNFVVEWNGDDFSVTFGPGYSLKINENSYILGRMMPIQLEIAPQLIEDKTYVPASYFEKVLGKKVTVENGVVNINE